MLGFLEYIHTATASLQCMDFLLCGKRNVIQTFILKIGCHVHFTPLKGANSVVNGEHSIGETKTHHF